MPRFEDDAICTRLIDWSETSQIVALLTREHGLIRGLAKGSKRMSPGSVARYSGGIELLSGGQVVAYTKSGRDLAGITEWNLQYPNPGLRQSLNAYRVAMYLADLVNHMLPEHDPHPAAYVLLNWSLTELQSGAHEPVLLIFQWLLLAEVGYQPKLDVDVHTGEVLAGTSATFDPIAGGLTNRPAASRDSSDSDPGPGPWAVRASTIKLLKRLAETFPAMDGQPRFDESLLKDIAAQLDGQGQALTRCSRLLCAYFRSLLDRELGTMPFLLRG